MVTALAPCCPAAAGRHAACCSETDASQRRQLCAVCGARCAVRRSGAAGLEKGRLSLPLTLTSSRLQGARSQAAKQTRPTLCLGSLYLLVAQRAEMRDWRTRLVSHDQHVRIKAGCQVIKCWRSGDKHDTLRLNINTAAKSVRPLPHYEQSGPGHDRPPPSPSVPRPAPAPVPAILPVLTKPSDTRALAPRTTMRTHPPPPFRPLPSCTPQPGPCGCGPACQTESPRSPHPRWPRASLRATGRRTAPCMRP